VKKLAWLVPWLVLMVGVACLFHGHRTPALLCILGWMLGLHWIASIDPGHQGDV
jgi:hypothetical protein